MRKVTDKNLAFVEKKRIQEYITRHAMVSLGLLKNISDPDYDIYLEKEYLFGMLIGILKNGNDLSIAREAHDYVDSLGYYLDVGDSVDRVQETRLKCQRELFVLNIALDLLYHEKEEPHVVLSKVCQLLE